MHTRAEETHRFVTYMLVLNAFFFLHIRTSGRMDRRSSTRQINARLLNTWLLVSVRSGSAQTEHVTGNLPPLPTNGMFIKWYGAIKEFYSYFLVHFKSVSKTMYTLVTIPVQSCLEFGPKKDK